MRATRSIRTAAGRSGKVRRDDALGAPCVYAARFPRANQALVEDRCDRRKRRSVHTAAYGRSGYRWQNNNRLTGQVKGPLVRPIGPRAYGARWQAILAHFGTAGIAAPVNLMAWHPARRAPGGSRSAIAPASAAAVASAAWPAASDAAPNP